MCDIQTDGWMRLLLLYRLVHLPIVNNGEKIYIYDFTYLSNTLNFILSSTEGI